MATATKTHSERIQKSKTPRQIAKRERNIAEAKKRLEIHQKRCVVRDQQRTFMLKNHLEELHRAEYVKNALAGPHGGVLRAWLKNRTATFDRVSRFFNERPQLKVA